MSSKEDRRVPQPVEQVNQKKEDPLDTIEYMRKDLSSRLMEILNLKLSPTSSPEETFQTLQEFVGALAQAMSTTLVSMEDVMCAKDKIYPRGMLAPIFMACFIEMHGGHCVIPNMIETAEELDALFSQVPASKSMMH